MTTLWDEFWSKFDTVWPLVREKHYTEALEVLKGVRGLVHAAMNSQRVFHAARSTGF